MMTFRPRKLFHLYIGSSDATMARRTNYSPTPSPLHSPAVLVPLFDGDHMNQNHVLIIMIVIASTASVIMFLIALSKILRYYYSRRYNVDRRNPPILFDIRGDFPFSDDEEQEQAVRHHIWLIPTEGLQQSIIDSITVCKYRKDEVLIKETKCLVCLGEFQQEESLRLLPKCYHSFHVPCIDTWLRSHRSCPLCRAPIVHDAASVGGGTETDSSLSDTNEDIEESESGGVRPVGDEEYSSEEGRDDGIQVLPQCDEVRGHSSILIGSASAVSAQEFEDEIEPMKRSVSVDSSSASMVLSDVLDLNLDIESSDTNTNLVIEKKVSVSSNNKDVAIAKQGCESSANYKQRHSSLRSSSHNTKFISCRRSKNQSTTLPL
ncbi:RING-H2 finger protein ATL54 [Spatholobus suberectus]|nr:RING-H2 finger protein ATL54 [Spatholobus suberectus]